MLLLSLEGIGYSKLKLVLSGGGRELWISVVGSRIGVRNIGSLIIGVVEIGSGKGVGMEEGIGIEYIGVLLVLLLLLSVP